MRSDEEVRAFWNRVYDALERKKLSVGDLANTIGVSYNIIPNWKTKGRYPQVEYLVPMASYLGYSVEFLLSGVDTKSESPGDKLYNALLEQAPAVLQGLIETYIEKRDTSSAPVMA